MKNISRQEHRKIFQTAPVKNILTKIIPDTQTFLHNFSHSTKTKQKTFILSNVKLYRIVKMILTGVVLDFRDVKEDRGTNKCQFFSGRYGSGIIGEAKS